MWRSSKTERRVAIITGGSGGIGSEIAKSFASSGIKVVIISRRVVAMRRVLNFIWKNGGEAEGMIMDVSSISSVRSSVKKIFKKYGRIDILVNCAAIQSPIGPFINTPLTNWKKNLEINLFGTVAMCSAVLPYMIKNRYGRIINFSGGGSTSSRPNFSAYAVAKTGVVRFTEILADEVKPYGISINAVAPGSINTRMLREILLAGKRAGNKETTKIKREIKRGGDSIQNVIELVNFLISSKSIRLTGRLISAVWDPWRSWSSVNISEIMGGEKYTLRRVK